ncbi:type II toxin-antitoxin system PemK/MazF family toxin [Roseofilum sp. BLCC_M114]|uniref:Type II toxin-antitoxin system PemK/MazF family toxin n=1 Tax=Roseofilum capinflatum BLCC-M114 TaxID=3022440 RepID=A0ABT7B323_9CYAN|nr:type II toxin-antitoxin system PemK/MazF family toxin [Roseofilum capinflatum]MDJ1172703.1 type II toxin-antitoxin system PemK/MazF family toxin [Roseofilum capinflatum BLCC-M114]
MNILRGDVVVCDLNPVVGTEQAGVRPAVVVQMDRANKASPHTIIVPLTSKIRHTHALIWWDSQPEKLPADIRALLSQPDTEQVVSVDCIAYPYITKTHSIAYSLHRHLSKG